MVEGRIERRLAAILAADVVGYSRLMGTGSRLPVVAMSGGSAVSTGTTALPPRADIRALTFASVLFVSASPQRADVRGTPPGLL